MPGLTAPTMAPELPPPPPPEKRGLESRVAIFGGVFLCLNVFALGCLAVAAPSFYDVLTREDYWVEYLTMVWFLLTGIVLFATALAERSPVRRGVYIVGAVAFLFAAGEEISWGQRIVGFDTPGLLLVWNESREFNAHNISNITFDRAYREGTLLLCMVTGAAFFCRKDALLGIPLPSILLALCFLAVLVMLPHRLEALGAPVFEVASFITNQGKGLLLLFAIYTIFAGQRRLFVITAAAIGIIIAFSYVSERNDVGFSSLYEVREYLFGIVCLCYAGELLLAKVQAQAQTGALARTAFTLQWSRLATIVGLAVGSLLIAGVIGLVAVLQYFSAGIEIVGFEERYRLITTGAAGEPVVSDVFDVYLSGNELTYFKEPCGREDTEAAFFLHLIPGNVDELPAVRRQYGFDNLDFYFDKQGETRDGGCMATRLLPDYAITDIRTGQYVPDDGVIWQGEFPFR